MALTLININVLIGILALIKRNEYKDMIKFSNNESPSLLADMWSRP